MVDVNHVGFLGVPGMRIFSRVQVPNCEGSRNS